MQIGGIPLTRIAQRVGKTPFFVYERQKITEQIKQLRQHLPDEIHLHYAVKANPMPAVVQHLSTLVDGFDVASVGEMHVALDSFVSSDQISFAGPGKTEHELSCAIAAGVVLSIESEQEMEMIDTLGNQLGVCPKITVRINPDFEFKSSGMKMGGGPKQFGIDVENIPRILARIGKLGLSFLGFHIFNGSQNLSTTAIQASQEKTLKLCIQLAENAPNPVSILNIGGGFGIPYFPGERALDLPAIGDNLHRLIPTVKQQLPNAQIIIELGRYIVGQAGVYVCKVLERKESRGQVFLVTDGGMHHHLAASGNLGQIIRKNYPVMIGNKVKGKRREIVSVVGPLCTPLDLLADQIEVAQASAGDLVAVLQSGAYGLTASPTAFLNHPKPLELII